MEPPLQPGLCEAFLPDHAGAAPLSAGWQQLQWFCAMVVSGQTLEQLSREAVDVPSLEMVKVKLDGV